MFWVREAAVDITFSAKFFWFLSTDCTPPPEKYAWQTTRFLYLLCKRPSHFSQKSGPLSSQTTTVRKNMSIYIVLASMHFIYLICITQYYRRFRIALFAYTHIQRLQYCWKIIACHFLKRGEKKEKCCDMLQGTTINSFLVNMFLSSRASLFLSFWQ